MDSLTRAPARSASPVWTLVACSAAVFMCVLDALVVTTALPVLRTGLHSGVSGLEWTVNAYNLTFACLLLTGAALGERFGRRRILCTGLAVFALASAAAALSPSVGILIAARAVQGAGAALVMPLTLTLVSSAFPAQKRGWAIGIWAAAGGLSGAIGPFAGGVIVQAIGWHWIFWINVPVGLALIPLTARKVRENFGDRPRLDLAGLVLASAGLLGILWALIRASTAGWGSAEVVSTLTAGAAITAGFLLWEHRAAHPMLPLAMFRQPRFAAANGVSFCLFAGLFGALFLMSQFFQTGSSMAYPAIASEVVSSVPAAQIGIASGANSALRELGGVFGVAILATVFTRPAVYTSAPAFTAGFSAALWAGAALTATGILLALAGRKRPAAAPAQPAPSHASTPEPALSAR